MAKPTPDVEPIPREVKAALVMLMLGEDRAAPVFKKLEKDELRVFRDALHLPVPDAKLVPAAFFHS